jgi:hypothetical protein
VREETARLSALVSVVGLLAMGVVRDGKGVFVLGSGVVHSHHWGCVIHSLANLGHLVDGQEGVVFLLLVNLFEAFLGAFVESTRVVKVTLKEAFTGEGHKLFTFIFSLERSFGMLFGRLQSRGGD